MFMRISSCRSRMWSFLSVGRDTILMVLRIEVTSFQWIFIRDFTEIRCCCRMRSSYAGSASGSRLRDRCRVCSRKSIEWISFNCAYKSSRIADLSSKTYLGYRVTFGVLKDRWTAFGVQDDGQVRLPTNKEGVVASCWLLQRVNLGCKDPPWDNSTGNDP
jgi:hypothetical protein